VLGGLGAAWTLLLATRLREPPRGPGGYAHESFVRQLGACARAMRDPSLAWIFAYVVLMTTLEHVPYEFTQPYVAAVLGEPVTDARLAPLVAGGLTAGFKLFGALAAARAIDLRDRFGTGPTLLGVTLLQGGLIAAMAVVVHPLVLGLLLVRSVQPAASNVIVNAEVAPRLPAAQRATYLSLHSLAGRLGYGGVLLALAALAGPEGPNDPATMASLLRWCTGLAGIGIAALALTRGALRREA
jgi:hypothetical protein